MCGKYFDYKWKLNCVRNSIKKNEVQTILDGLENISLQYANKQISWRNLESFNY